METYCSECDEPTTRPIVGWFVDEDDDERRLEFCSTRCARKEQREHTRHGGTVQWVTWRGRKTKAPSVSAEGSLPVDLNPPPCPL